MAMPMLVLYILILILMLPNLITGYADSVSDLCCYVYAVINEDYTK